MNTIRQFQNMGNPQQMAMKSLSQAVENGNPIARNLLEKINSGDYNGAGEVLTNCANNMGMNISEIQRFLR